MTKQRITLKRSAAALGVVAGLLAAAGPASAQLPSTTNGVTASPTAEAEMLFKGEMVGLEPAAGTETGNPERRGSLNASGGWDPTLGLNSQGIALHAVATAVVGGLVPGGAIVSA
jgi:hypothetical protein